MQLLHDIVDGKSVALVGNAVSLASMGKADEIDAHAVVIRMNLGLPQIVGKLAGRRTTVWTTGKYWHVPQPPTDCKLMLFMKLTALGDRDWSQWSKTALPFPAVRWPLDLEQQCHDFVGADPGTGIRLLWWLKKVATPATVNIYGMDCWATPSNWSGRFESKNHKPDLERLAIERLLA